MHPQTQLFLATISYYYDLNNHTWVNMALWITAGALAGPFPAPDTTWAVKSTGRSIPCTRHHMSSEAVCLCTQIQTTHSDRCSHFTSRHSGGPTTTTTSGSDGVVNSTLWRCGWRCQGEAEGRWIYSRPVSASPGAEGGSDQGKHKTMENYG